MNSFELPANVHIIALGHKARNGKDTISNYISELYPNTIIMHWADEVYRQVRNEERKNPLIISSIVEGITYYQLKDEDLGPNAYRVFTSDNVPVLHELFTNRDITVYWGMDEKDAEMLQFWGTNFRRVQKDLYWVDKIQQRIEEVCKNLRADDPLIITIPDTRFENEWNHVRSEIGGIYVECIRYNEDGTQYIADDRDPKHDSECQLDGYPCDYFAEAKSGDLNQLKEIAKDLISITISKIEVSSEAA